MRAMMDINRKRKELGVYLVYKSKKRKKERVKKYIDSAFTIGNVGTSIKSVNSKGTENE